MRALIVDDSRFSRLHIRRILEGESMECEEAVDAEEGLKQLRARGAFDLMLVDWNMPGMSGPEMIALVRQQGMAELKILMVSTVEGSEYIAQALEGGANDFLMKPFEADALKEKLVWMGLDRVAG